MDEKKDKQEGQDENALEKPSQPGEFNALESLSDAGEGGNVKAAPDEQPKKAKKPKKDSRLRRLWGMFNVYLLIFLLLLVIAGIVFVVSYINSQREPEMPTPGLQELTQEELSEIASGDATVGDPRYILNIQSDAVFAGNALVRGDLSVAGNLQLGQGLSVPSITVSGESNLATVQINTLAVAGATTLQGALNVQNSLTVRDSLDVGGAATFNGPLTATSITTGTLTLAGNGNLVLQNHILANGPTPSRSNGGSLGSGGSTSISGSDTAGTININTGNNPSSGCLVNISFRQQFNGTPRVQVTPVGAEAGRLNFYVNRSSTGFSICSQNAPNNGRSFAFDYFVIN